MKSDDAGRSWASIKGNLPEKGTVYSIAEDHMNKDLLFAGTEFGVFFTIDGGKKWIQLKGGLPTIAVHDIAIQKRENDLVLGTFGRGFYILDDYSPLRNVNTETLAAESHLFQVKPSLMYIESRPYGYKGRGFMGESFYAAENPPFGATFTYYLKDAFKTKKKLRQEKEKELLKRGETPPYPTLDGLRAEDEEEEPTVILTITDEAANVVRKMKGPISQGMNRVTWDLRYPPLTPIRLVEETPDAWTEAAQSPLAMPGMYKVSLAKRVDGVETELSVPQEFTASILGTTTLPASDRKPLAEFQRKVAELQRATMGASRAVDDLKERIAYIKKALYQMPAPAANLVSDVGRLEAATNEIIRALRGDRTLSSRNEPTPPSISDRVNGIVDDQWQSTGAPTQTQIDAYNIAGDEFTPVLAKLRTAVQTDLRGIEIAMESLGAPWTPGRIPEWKK
ncbi:MAG TPA: hypothetical protein DGH68_00390 [Bacteroidetes bacterium]|nr:hypothetical protein [Bacteroidota bacterium]